MFGNKSVSSLYLLIVSQIDGTVLHYLIYIGQKSNNFCCLGRSNKLLNHPLGIFGWWGPVEEYFLWWPLKYYPSWAQIGPITIVRLWKFNSVLEPVSWLCSLLLVVHDSHLLWVLCFKMFLLFYVVNFPELFTWDGWLYKSIKQTNKITKSLPPHPLVLLPCAM